MNKFVRQLNHFLWMKMISTIDVRIELINNDTFTCYSECIICSKPFCQNTNGRAQVSIAKKQTNKQTNMIKGLKSRGWSN